MNILLLPEFTPVSHLLNDLVFLLANRNVSDIVLTFTASVGSVMIRCRVQVVDSQCLKRSLNLKRPLFINAASKFLRALLHTLQRVYSCETRGSSQ